MKLTTLLIFQCLPFFLFGQPLLIQKTIQVYNTDEAVWENDFKENWTYTDFNEVQNYQYYSWNFETNDWQIREEENHNFDENRNPIFSQKTFFDEEGEQIDAVRYNRIFIQDSLLNYELMEEWDEGSWSLKRSFYAEYNTSNQPIIEIDSVSCSEVRCNIYLDSFYYDLHGNLIEDVYYQTDGGLPPHEMYIRSRHLYEYDAENRLIQKLRYSNGNLTDTIALFNKETYEYNIDNQLERQTYYTWQEEADTFKFHWYFTFEYDEQGDISFKGWHIIDTILAKKSEWEKDAFGNLIFELTAIIQPSYIEELRYEADLTYDDQDYLIENSWERITTDLPISILTKQTDRYKNYCSGIPYLITENQFLPTLKIQRNFYEYKNLPECPETKLEPTLTIFPNPNDGNFILQSNLLEFEDSEIKIFDANGRQLKSFKLDYATHQVSISSLDLPSGIYFVKIQSKDFYKTEKVFIFGSL